MQSFASEFQTHRVVSESLVVSQMVWKIYWCLSERTLGRASCAEWGARAGQQPAELDRPEAKVANLSLGLVLKSRALH